MVNPSTVTPIAPSTVQVECLWFEAGLFDARSITITSMSDAIICMKFSLNAQILCPQTEFNCQSGESHRHEPTLCVLRSKLWCMFWTVAMLPYSRGVITSHNICDNYWGISLWSIPSKALPRPYVLSHLKPRTKLCSVTANVVFAMAEGVLTSYSLSGSWCRKQRSFVGHFASV